MSDILQKIKQLEEKGEYNTHLNPPNLEDAKPFGADFPYIPKGWLRVKYALINFFIVKPFRRYQAKWVYKTKVTGRHHLKNVGPAILICNHIAIFDCMAISFSLKNRKLKFVAAEFNNKKGWFGEAMRAHGILPFSNKYAVLKKFNNAIKHYLLHNNLIVIYPEEAMWDMYQKPRPFKKGAFYYAAKFDVPVIPTFITLREPKKTRAGLKSKKYFTLNFSAPVYPKQELTTEENIEYLKDAAQAACTEIYEKTYDKKLVF